MCSNVKCLGDCGCVLPSSSVHCQVQLCAPAGTLCERENEKSHLDE